MTLKTSLIITGDSATARAAVDDLTKSVDRLNTTSRGAATATGALAVAEDVGAASAGAAAVAQGAVAVANEATAVTSRTAAVAQGALAVATDVGTASMAAFGVTALTTEAILTGGLSLALTAVIGFLTGFAGELFSAGNEASASAGKVDSLTASIDRLRKAKGRVSYEDLGNGEVLLRQQEGQLARLNNGSDASTRAGRQAALQRAQRRQELENAIADTRAMDAEQSADRSTPAPKSSRGAKRANDELASSAREAAQAQKQLQADLDGVIGRYDPATKAASDYADELERIAKLQKAGKITPDQASDYKAGASAAYLGKAIDWADIKGTAKGEQASINAAGAIDKIVASIKEERSALQSLDPVQRAMLGYRKELAALSPEERAAAEERIRNALAEKEATEQLARSAEDARRAKEQLAGAAIDAFTAIAVGGQKAGDVVKRLAQSITSAAIEATLLGTGPLAFLLNGAIGLPDPGGPKSSGGGIAAQAAGAELVGKSVGKSVSTAMDKLLSKGGLGSALRNAGLGYVAGGATGSSTGGAIGGVIGGEIGKQVLGKAAGAIGGALGKTLGSIAGPLGAIAGGLLGGVIGGLFKKTKTGSATIGNVDGQGKVTGTAGNSESYKQAATGLAGGVLSNLDSVVSALGGELGSFAVSIGQRKKKFVVDTSGSGKTKGAGTQSYDSAEEAAAAALTAAIAQGAVKGISDAMQKALRSSSDVNAGVTEALKVHQVELAIGGIGAVMADQFKAFEAQAKERVRIATQYGFDVVAIEKKNAEDRAKLTEQLLEAQVGSLQRLVDEMTGGSLFEGSAVEQRTAVLASIEKAKADLDAGVDGAADKLAGLFEQLNAVSKEAYGTTGQFAADRASILSQSQAAIAKANANIAGPNSATGASTDPALTQAAAAMDENNDQNAQLIALMKTLPVDIAGLLSSTNYSSDLASLARTS